MSDKSNTMELERVEKFSFFASLLEARNMQTTDHSSCSIKVDISLIEAWETENRAMS